MPGPVGLSVILKPGNPAVGVVCFGLHKVHISIAIHINDPGLQGNAVFVFLAKGNGGVLLPAQPLSILILIPSPARDHIHITISIHIPRGPG